MNYEKEILQKLENEQNWPSIKKPDLMAKLDGFAEEALIHPNEQNLISSILIYQQLTEELLKITLETSQFLIQVRLLPWEQEFQPVQKKMFGRLVKEFETTIEFPSKTDMIKYANMINEKRIKVAHGLIHSYDLSTINEDTKNVNSWFFKFFHHYDIAQDFLNSSLRELREEWADL